MKSALGIAALALSGLACATPAFEVDESAGEARVLAERAARPSGAAPVIGDDALFFSDSERSRCGNEPISSYWVHRAPLDGGAAMTLAEIDGPNVASLAYDGRSLFAVEQDSEGRRALLEVGERGVRHVAELPDVGDERSAVALLADDVNVYAALDVGPCVGIHRVDKRTGNVVSARSASACLPAPLVGFTAARRFLYVLVDASRGEVSSPRVVRISKESGAESAIALALGPKGLWAESLVADEDAVYFVALRDDDGATAEIRRLDVALFDAFEGATLEGTLLAELGLPEARWSAVELVAAEGGVIFAEPLGDAGEMIFGRVPKQGGAVARLGVAFAPRRVALRGGWLAYFEPASPWSEHLVARRLAP